jgi:hypothetical protein
MASTQGRLPVLLSLEAPLHNGTSFGQVDTNSAPPP